MVTSVQAKMTITTGSLSYQKALRSKKQVFPQSGPINRFAILSVVYCSCISKRMGNQGLGAWVEDEDLDSPPKYSSLPARYPSFLPLLSDVFST